MPYTPDATDVAAPTDTGIAATTAAAEFRAIKAYMAATLLAGLNLKAPLAAPAFTGGITLNNTEVAGATKLDWYEEGAWTPSVGGTATNAFQSGSFTRIGNRVHFSCLLIVNVIGTGSASVISGLPYVAAAAHNYSASVSSASSLATAIVSIGAHVNASASTITLAGRTAASTNEGTSTILGTGATITIAGTYKV